MPITAATISNNNSEKKTINEREREIIAIISTTKLTEKNKGPYQSHR